MHAFREAFHQRDATKEVDLRDKDGERVVASRRVSASNIVNEAALRRELATDLTSLMNTINFASSEDIKGLDHVKKSILNYGLDDIGHRTLEEMGVNDIQHELLNALLHFEPRLVRQTIEVERDQTIDISAHKLRFTINAEMHATPVDVPVEFYADLELASGKMKISRL